MSVCLCVAGDECFPEEHTPASTGELVPVQVSDSFWATLSQRSQDPRCLDQSSHEGSGTGSAGERAVALARTSSAEQKGVLGDGDK